ncbi:hypothetical protein Tco_1447209, partial [Tanacetum coccineum]
SSKKPQDSDASASKQHPTLTSTGWQITDIRDAVIDSLMHRSEPESGHSKHSSDDISKQDKGHVSDLEDIDNAHIPKANAYATTYQVLAKNKLQRKTYDIGSFIQWFCRRTGKKKLCKADLEGPAFNHVKAFHKNIDLEYLLTGDKERKTALSISKLKVARYLDFGLEVLVPSLWVESERDYDISAAYEDYTIVPKPRAVIYRDRNDQRKLMRLNEIHKFSDGTLTRVMEKLDHMVKYFYLFEYNRGMETRKWSEDDKRRSKDFISAIKKRLQIRRIFRKHPSETKVFHNEDGNPARANIIQALGSYERPHKGVKASANSDIMYFFTSAQDGDPLQDDVRLCLGNDLNKAQDHNQRQVKDESKDHYPKCIRYQMSMGYNVKDAFGRIELNKGRLLNSKFVNNMLPEWGRFVTAVKLNKGLKDSNFDQLYAYLKQHEAHANENKMMLEHPVNNRQGRQNRGQGNNARGAGAAGYGGAQNRVGNANPGQARQDNAIDEDVDEQPVQDLALNVDNVFQADDCDAYDFDVDEAPTSQTMFMANLLSADPVYDEAGPMQNDVQQSYVVDSHVDYTSDSNMTPYDQYVKDNAVLEY